MLEDVEREFPPGPMVVIIWFNPKFEVALKVRKFGTTEALRTTEKTEFQEIADDSAICAFGLFSVHSVVLSVSVVILPQTSG
jgi:hypothetical protein